MSEEEKTYIDDENKYIVDRGIFGNWQVTIISEELKEALRNDIKRQKNEPSLRRGFQIPSADFNKCMNKYGFEEFNDENYPIDYHFRGYTVFKGNDNEMYIKIIFKNFYDKTGKNEFELSAYYEGDDEYNNDILDIHWKTVFDDVYKAIISFLKDEDCSGERAKKEVKEKERRIIREKEEALAAEYEAKKELTRKLLENREKKLVALRERLIEEQAAKKNIKLNNNTNYYESNEGYKSANSTNTKLISRFEFNTPVAHQFIIAVKNKEYIDAIDEDERINYSELNDITVLPVWNLSVKQFMCMGLSKSFVKDSIHKANITIALIEPTAEKDDSYFAGIATLLVKKDAIEIDTICSQIGYKMAGKILINKIIKIAKKLGKSKIELLSVGNPDTIKFYKRFLFKRVNPENEFAKKGTRKGLIAYRRRVTRKKAVSDKPAGGAGRALSDSN